jgi:hypothetical protein
MKKRITLWSIVLSMFFATATLDANAQERQTAPKSTPSPDVKSQLERQANENSRLPEKVKLEQMSPEERVNYLKGVNDMPLNQPSIENEKKSEAQLIEEKIQFLKENHPDLYYEYLKNTDPGKIRSEQRQSEKVENIAISSDQELKAKQKESLYINNRNEYERIYNSQSDSIIEMSYSDYIQLPEDKRIAITSNPDKYKVIGGPAK